MVHYVAVTVVITADMALNPLVTVRKKSMQSLSEVKIRNLGRVVQSPKAHQLLGADPPLQRSIALICSNYFDTLL